MHNLPLPCSLLIPSWTSSVNIFLSSSSPRRSSSVSSSAGIRFAWSTRSARKEFSFFSSILSGFRRESFVFLYPFLLTLLLHLCSNLWYILNLIHLQKYQSIEVQRFFEYCSRDMLDMNVETKRCTCVRENDNDKYLVDMPCMKVKLLIELLQLMPFVRWSNTLRFLITLSTRNRLAFCWFWLIFTHSYWWHSCIFTRKDHY